LERPHDWNQDGRDGNGRGIAEHREGLGHFQDRFSPDRDGEENAKGGQGHQFRALPLHDKSEHDDGKQTEHKNHFQRHGRAFRKASCPNFQGSNPMGEKTAFGVLLTGVSHFAADGF